MRRLQTRLVTMSSKIKMLLQNIDKAREHLTGQSEHSLAYKSMLAEFAKRGPRLPSPPKQSAIKQAIALWHATTDQNYSSLPKRTIRTLCCVSEVASTDKFLNLLRKLTDQVSPQMNRDLLGVYFHLWADKEHRTHLEDFLSENIGNYQGNDKLMLAWKENIRVLLGADAPAQLAWKLSKTLQSVESFLAELQLPRQYSKFSTIVVEQLASIVLTTLDHEGLPEFNKWNYFKDYLLTYQTLSADQFNDIVAKSILKIDLYRGRAVWDSLHEYLRDFILKHPGLGDPRIESLNWEQFDKEARLAFITWLVEEDISIFFELIISDDPHQRKPYWLRYAKKAISSMVIVGPGDYQSHLQKLKELRKEGLSFSRGVGLPSSAFILDFGKVVVVEFNESGNACYVYSKNDLPGFFKTTQSGLKNLRLLKRKEKAIHIQRHRGRTWQESLDAKLLELGVQAID
jgi:hypothetical protein